MDRRIESFGLGQSGYTAGRVETDPSLRFEALNCAWPWGEEDRAVRIGLDERYTGTGGVHWYPQRT